MRTRLRPELFPATITALKWHYLGLVVRSFAGLVLGVILARLLGPEPYGQFAVAWLVVSLGNLVADLGFGATLVQRRELSTEDVRYAFTIQVLIGFGLSAVVFLCAGAFSRLIAKPEATSIVRMMGSMFLVQALGQTAASLLKRQLEFRRIQVAQVSSYILGYGFIGIPLAYMGAGVWSLVGAQLSQSLLFAMQVLVAVRHTVRPLLRVPSRGFASFGGRVLGTNLANWFVENMDTVFVARAFDLPQLGLYNRALGLARMPNTFVAALQAVLFSTYSRLQEDPMLVGRTYLASVSAVALVTWPILGVMAAIPHTVIEGLYGARWMAASSVLSPLAVAMGAHATMAVAGPMLWGTGRVAVELRIQLVIGLLLAVGLSWASRSSSLAVLAWVVAGLYVLRSALLSYAALQLVGRSRRDLAGCIRGPLLLAFGVAVGARSTDSLLHGLGVDAAARLVADMTVVALVGTLALWLIRGYLLGIDLRDALRRLCPAGSWLLRMSRAERSS